MKQGMFVQNKIIMVCVLLICSCDVNTNENSLNKSTKDDVMHLNQLLSGYSSERSKSQWDDFLLCWLGSEKSKILEKLSVSYESEDIQKIISIKENELGVKLPKSYIDFLISYRPGKFLFNQKWKEQGIGFLAVEDVIKLYEFDKDIVDVHIKNGFNSDDKIYYLYGVDQDTAFGRVSNYRDAIVVGKHGYSSYETILLYPNSLTLDGEMEAALLSHAYEFRAPSFAELMRQLSVLETENRDAMPPYSQDSIKNTCAAKLKLDPIWWR